MTSIILTFVLLLSCINVTYGTHFCGDQLVKQSILLGKQDISCASMTKTSSCNNEKHDDFVIKRSKCCDTNYGSIDTDTNYKSASYLFSFSHLFVLNQYTFRVEKPEVYLSSIVAFLSYIPPPRLHKNYAAFIQVFRI